MSRRSIVRIRRMLITAVLALLLTTIPISASANSGSWSGGLCTVSAHNVHKSSHSPGRINGIGEVNCTYDPAGSLLLETQMQKEWILGIYFTTSTTLTVLKDTATHVRHSRSRTCQSDKYRMKARAYAAGPNGQTARWSLWAVGHSSSIDCD